MKSLCTAARPQNVEPISASLVMSLSRPQSDHGLIEAGMGYMSVGSGSVSLMRSYRYLPTSH